MYRANIAVGVLFILFCGMICGCTHQKFMTDARNPEIQITLQGDVTYRGEVIDPEDLPSLLRDSGLTKRDTIHLRIPDGLKDYRVPYYLMGLLARNGFSRPILVTERHSASERGKWIDKGKVNNGDRKSRSTGKSGKLR